MRFIGNQDYSFYNVETPLDGVNYDRIDDRLNFDIDSSASPGSTQNPQSNYNFADSEFSMSDSIGSSKIQQINQGASSFVVSKGGEFDPRLQVEAYNLQQ